MLRHFVAAVFFGLDLAANIDVVEVEGLDDVVVRLLVRFYLDYNTKNALDEEL